MSTTSNRPNVASQSSRTSPRSRVPSKRLAASLRCRADSGARTNDYWRLTVCRCSTIARCPRISINRRWSRSRWVRTNTNPSLVSRSTKSLRSASWLLKSRLSLRKTLWLALVPSKLLFQKMAWSQVFISAYLWSLSRMSSNPLRQRFKSTRKNLKHGTSRQE